jgi:cGMP-dependent protein kinase
VTDDHIAEVGSIPLFATLGYREREVLATYLTRSSCQAGQTIVQEGDAGHSFFVIARGSVEISKGGKAIRELHAGGVSGEMAIAERGIRTATATAKSDVEVWSMRGDDLRRLESEHPDISNALQAVIDERSDRGN